MSLSFLEKLTYLCSVQDMAEFFSFLLRLEVFIITESTGNLNWMMNYIVNMN